jgi:hypothetical protein
MNPASDPAIARVHSLLALYRRTHYRVRWADGSESIIEIDAMPPAPIATWIGASGFAAYLTACNPYSQALTEQQNEARLADLRRRLRAADARFLEGIASVPAEAWSEPSLLVTGVPLQQVDALAREFEQNAVVFVPRDACPRLRVYRSDWFDVVRTSTDFDWADR